MRISSFQLENYKSFLDAQKLCLQPGFNFIVGQNNVGKTALLEALTLLAPGNPHRSMHSLPSPTSPLNPISILQVDIVVSGKELRDIFLSNLGSVNLPFPTNNPQEQRIAEDTLNTLLAQPEITLRFTVSSPGGVGVPLPREFPSHGLYVCDTRSGNSLYAKFAVAPNRSGFVFNRFVSMPQQDEFSAQVGNLLRQRIYFFRAERLTLASGQIGNNPTLAPDAENLPEVLHLLQAKNPARFNRLNKLLQRVFPSIEQVSVRPTAGNPSLHEIVVWTENPETERDDLAIELSSSGTGVGQVLAMLYVVINSDSPRTIIIDEPNSFLHPSAARRLMEILGEFPKHQYVLSTHSPEILGAVTPATLTLIRWEKPRSVLEHLDPDQVSDLQKCLLEIGVRLSDVFGADNILWVEGPTEEECFGRILRALVGKPWTGTRILAVKNTGDFQRKHKGVALAVC